MKSGRLIICHNESRTSILLVNSAEIRDLYDQALNKEDKFDAGLDTLLTKRIGSLASLVAKEKEGGNKPPFVKLSDGKLSAKYATTKHLSDVGCARLKP